MRKTCGVLREPPFAVAELLHLPWQGLPRNAVVLHQPGHRQSGGKQRRDDLPEAVVPLVRDVVREHRVGRHIGPGEVGDHRLGLLKVRVPDHQQVIGTLVVERPEHRMPLADEQPSARPQQVTDHRSPAPYGGQPAQRADPGINQIELAGAESRDGTVDVGPHERRVRAGSGGQ